MASDLRKAALTNNSASTESLIGERKSTQLQTSESEVNLIRPALYSIYNTDSVTELSKDDEDNASFIEFATKEQLKKHEQQRQQEVLMKNKRTLVEEIIITIVKLACMGASAFFYNCLVSYITSRQIDSTEFQQQFNISKGFLQRFIAGFRISRHVDWIPSKLDSIDEIVGLLFQGLVMSLFHPLMDSILPSSMTRRLLLSNPDAAKSLRQNFFNDSLRAVVAVLGVSYAIRKIEFNSMWQMSVVWSLLNPSLWLLLDGTLSGFIASTIVTLAGCVRIYFQNKKACQALALSMSSEYHAIWLWISSFFFCGVIIFGKLGRSLLT
ncbi:uncharacterized protein KQ657_003540 [Scheffersomyces spartinae]|uniref:Uncharacterized protein n=1 Tax=Scheffersomyces spartinae TaxID=45513 RepID=A0A9P8AGF4_9ASCO|nr:uncharacterized protein KQ657_003540 [Scheffersomyces spartinae]KAG7191335.1 hypothetical protein KQ657_003540 [Scheffersomyces spartinae]